MPTWGELLKELGEIAERLGEQPPGHPSAFDVLRRKYLGLLTDRTGRATFLYYSGWLESSGAAPQELSVGVTDMTGFMEACSNAEQRELDLFLHSPGGDPDAAEQICAYLRTQFDYVRAVVPMAAMSAATMIALSCDEVIMGAHSQLGPIDPQVTIRTPEGARGASAQAVHDQFALAKEECKDPSNLPAWMPILRTLAPGLLAACDHATKRAQEIVATALEAHMFSEFDDARKKAEDTAAWFGNAEQFLSHGRPVRRDEAREHDVVVADLEADDELQDLMLSVHHATLHTLGNTPTVKLIENDQGRAWVRTQRVAAGPQLVLQEDQKAPSKAKGKKAPPPPPRKRRKRR